jgi:hypothetical protein
LKGLYERDANLLNSDSYSDIKAKLAEKLGCSKSLIDKSRREILKVVEDDASDEPNFPPAPSGTGHDGKNALVKPPLQQGNQSETPNQETDEPMLWDSRKVGVIMSAAVNVPGWFLEEWVPIQKEEKDELGKSFLDLFKEYLPTTKKTGNVLFTMAALEQILKPRAMAVMQHRLQGKKPDEVKAQALKEIREARVNE